MQKAKEPGHNERCVPKNILHQFNSTLGITKMEHTWAPFMAVAVAPVCELFAACVDATDIRLNALMRCHMSYQNKAVSKKKFEIHKAKTYV